jgi:hypothetical protein
MNYGKLRILAFSAAAVGLLSVGPSLATAAGGPSRGLPTSGTKAGPVEVFTDASAASSPFGTLVDTDVFLENKGTEPVRVYLTGSFQWPDGTSTRLRYGQPFDLPANSGVILLALSLAPASVGSGAGTFTATAFVASIGNGGRGGFRGPLIAQDSSPFQLP